MSIINHKQIVKSFEKNDRKNVKRRALFLKGREHFVVSQIKSELRQHPTDLTNIKLLLELMQLSNNEDVYNKVSLKEIESTYKSLSEIMKDDIDINIEYYYFLKNALNKNRAAKSHLEKFKKYTLKKIDTALLE